MGKVVHVRDLADRLARLELDVHPEELVHIYFAFRERRDFGTRHEEEPVSPLLCARAIVDLPERDDQAALESRGAVDVQLARFRSEIAARGTGEHTPARREHRFRCVGDWFDDELAAKAVRFTHPSDDDIALATVGSGGGAHDPR